MGCPDCDGPSDGGAAVDDCEFVVAGGQSTPLLDDIEAAFDDVAALVVCGIERRWASTGWATPLAVGDLIGRFGNDRDDPASAQLAANSPTRIGLISTHTVGSGAWPAATATSHPQVGQQMLEDRGVVGVSGRHQDHQRSAGAVDELVDLAGQPAAGATHAVVRRLDAGILVIRPSPLCDG